MNPAKRILSLGRFERGPTGEPDIPQLRLRLTVLLCCETPARHLVGSVLEEYVVTVSASLDLIKGFLMIFDNRLPVFSTVPANTVSRLTIFIVR